VRAPAAPRRTRTAEHRSCRTLLNAYERLDVSLRHHFTADRPVPHHLTKAIVNYIEAQENPVPLSAPSKEISPAPPRRSRRALSASVLAGVAAVLLLTLLVGLVYATHGRGTRPAHQDNATPTAVPVSEHEL